MNWRWRDTPEPLEPRGVIGLGGVAEALLQAMQASPRPGCQAVASDGLLMVTGAAAQLPWVDGVYYVAPCPEAAALWLPTNRQPDVALDLLARALVRQHSAQPMLLLDQPALLLSLATPLPADEAWLQRLRARWATV
jgi:D-aminopeptidase